MKKNKNTHGKPMKFILHMAKHETDWAGKAVSFEKDKTILFNNLKEFRYWLDNEISITQQELTDD